MDIPLCSSVLVLLHSSKSSGKPHIFNQSHNSCIRDELVIKWVRKIQGEVLKRIRGRVIFFIKRKTESQIFTLKPFMDPSEFEFAHRCMRRREIRGS